MYNEKLLFKGNRLSEEELADILNPIKQEELDKYDKLLNLEGLMTDIEDFYEKFIGYLQTGNSAQYDKNYQTIEETVTVKRYHKKVPTLKPEIIDDEIELEQTSDNDIWIDCTADTEGAVSYDFTYTRKKLFEKGNEKIRYDLLTGKEIFEGNLKNIIETNFSLPPNLKALNTININDTIQNLLDIKDVFIDNPQYSNRVCIMLIDCILEGLNDIINNIEVKYKQKDLIDVSKLVLQLPSLRANWKACYDAYEKTKNFGFSGYKKANYSDLDSGYSINYKDLMAKYGIEV